MTAIETTISHPLKTKAYQYLLFQLPEHGLSWLHYLDKNDRDICPCDQLAPGSYTLIGVSGSTATLRKDN